MEFAILYSDENLLAVDKPAGLLSIPDGYHPEKPCAINLLQQVQGRLWVVHRLDKETSGVLLFARNPDAHKWLNDQFQTRRVHKIYHAIIAGNPTWDHQEIALPLKVDGDRNHRTRVNLPGSKPAQTDISLIDRYPGYSLVEARPHTGYTHQIRAHLAAIGFPILSDPLYGRNAAIPNGLISRLALHAYQIVVSLPGSKTPIRITAPYPLDFQGALDQLSRLKN